MKFRTLILASIIALVFSACAGPAADMNLDDSPETGVGEEGSGSIGDLIGNFGGAIDDDEDGSDDEGESEENDDGGVLSCKDDRATLTDGKCVCPTGYYMGDNGLCKKFSFDGDLGSSLGDGLVLGCTDPNAKFSEGKCVCKKYYSKNSAGKCVSWAGVIESDIDATQNIYPGAIIPPEESDPTIYVKELDITIWTGSKKHSGTNSNVFFAMRSGDTSEWPEYDKEDATATALKIAGAMVATEEFKDNLDAEAKGMIADYGHWTKLDDPNDDDDREKNNVNKHHQTLYDPIPLDEVTGFTIYHDGTKDHSGWLLDGIEVRAHLVNSAGDTVDKNGTVIDGTVYPIFLYYNPWVLKWVDDQKINFTMNDIAVMTNVVTDSAHHKEKHDGESVKSGTDNTVFLDINLLAPKNPLWGGFHDVDMGAALDSSSEGLDFLLNWENENNNDKGDDETYGDFVSLKKIEDFKPDHINLRLGDDGDDWWRPASLKTYIFKPARVFRRKHGELACWYFQEDMSDGKTVLEPDEESGAFHPESEDCTDILIDIHNSN